MLNYYINPLNKTLVLVDSETEKIIVCEQLTDVRVFTAGGGVALVDGVAGLKGREPEAPAKPYPRPYAKRIGKDTSAERKPATCKKCGKVGHNSRSCRGGGA